MKITRTSLSSMALVVASFIATAVLYDRLPASVPTHWNARGVADGFTPKPWGPFLLPLTMLGVFALLFVLPRIAPRGYRMERFQGAFEILQTAILGFLLVLTLLALLAGIGAPVPMDRAIYAATGLLLVVLGNFMGKLTKNFFVGIRTPWTLASDEVWLRTHRLGGKVFVLAGLGLLVSGLVGGGTVAVFAAAVGAAVGVPVLYSYVLYRRIEGFTNGPPGEDPSRSST
jgi:uncharacterized membrane protein